MKRVLSVLLAVCLLVVALPLSASAETYEGSCGDDAEWVLNSETGVLTISGTGPMKDYSYFMDTPWKSYARNIKKLVVNSGITHIGNNSFYSYNTGITSIELADTVTSIGKYAFCQSRQLVTCNLPDSITTIGPFAFCACPKLQLSKLPSALTSLGDSAFKDSPCIGPAIEIPQGIKDIPNNAFDNCAGIKKITIPEGIENIGNWSFSKTSIVKLVIPSTAKSIGSNAFYRCKSLRFVDMKGGTSIHSDCFGSCVNLEKINLPETLISISSSYITPVISSDKLTYLYIPRNVTSLGSSYFDCANLKTICIANPDCKINSSAQLGKKGVATIFGEKDSTSEAYAKSKGYSFKLLGSEPKPPADPVINDDVPNPGDEDPVNPSAPQFKDVPAGAYYAKAVDWAVKNNITSGTSNTTFSPSQYCDRGQIVTFLWRSQGSPEPKSTSNPFKDVKSGDYFYKAVLWAVENNITSGTSATTFSPKTVCTRAQAMTFIWNAREKPAATVSNPFTDVKGGYYYNAVLWAVGNKVTSGTSATTFSPGKDCTRGQIVTFLYNAKDL